MSTRILPAVIPVVLIMFGGRSQLDSTHPDRLWNLGRFGLPCNVVACLLVVQSIVIYCFPATQVRFTFGCTNPR
jgi:hypothetical protein